MKKNPTLIKFHDTDSNTISHYYNYAVAINKIKELLIQKLGHGLKLCTTEVGIEEVFVTTQQLLERKDEDIQVLAHIYDTVGTTSLNQAEDDKYTVTPSLVNNIFYFPKFEVAIVRVPIYQSHSDYMQDFIFNKDDQMLLDFLDFCIEKQRKFMLDGITVLTDTEEGLQRSREQMTYQIPREEVLLDDDVKMNIFRSIDEFFSESGSFFKEYNIPYKRGILLHGSPGNGKTTLVKSIAGSVSAPVVYWQITEYTSSYSIKEVFTTVTKMAPMILIIEDIDSMPEESRSVFLNTLDGATTKEGIFLIGTTNYPEKIDPALINRAGRFDRAYEIKQPDERLRKEYLLKKGLLQFLNKETLNSLAIQTKGLSTAQLNELYMSIALEWHYEKAANTDKIVKELQENQKKTMKRDWESDEYAERLGF